ncbi:DUF485 domain-containing protein [Carboxylicivirga marina]|uniref:DUF485 domain-containing protein n=1 Tax=Carboxylicivirga marina TaxID=2800988 RepID=A0ABS1HLQ2_9BACT|nr:DUF485 domain-containing protein [Carboxylicivirga marina]MBK3518609.1 DUF485 domain-containing protein [Carboxylicivirga marina]
MEHGPAAKLGVDHASKKKSKLGVILFIFYSLVYAGFVVIGVVNYELMGKIIFAGQNLAVVYGFGLIIFAIVLGLIYNAICTNYENSMNKEDK